MDDPGGLVVVEVVARVLLVVLVEVVAVVLVVCGVDGATAAWLQKIFVFAGKFHFPSVH